MCLSFVTPEGFKPPTCWSVVSCSIQLSYGAVSKIVCKGTTFFSIDKKEFHFFCPNPSIFLTIKKLKTTFFWDRETFFVSFFQKSGGEKGNFDIEKTQKKRDIQKLLPTCKIRNKIVTLQCRFVRYLSKELRK